MARTVNWPATGWIANQSCKRLAAFLMAAHKPAGAGASSLDFIKSDIAVFLEGPEPGVVGVRFSPRGSAFPRRSSNYLYVRHRIYTTRALSLSTRRKRHKCSLEARRVTKE